jgi:hypothetical protein
MMCSSGNTLPCTIHRSARNRYSRKFVSRALNEAKRTPTEEDADWGKSLQSACKEPSLAIWARQARLMSGQAPEAYRRG